jgi:hypothetical protein
LKKHYLRLTEDEILEEYLKAVDILTINEEHRLRRKVQKLTQETDQIKELQRQIVEINQKIGKTNPYDLTDEIEEFKQKNSDEYIGIHRKLLKRQKLENELIAKGVPRTEALERTFNQLWKQEEPSALD